MNKLLTLILEGNMESVIIPFFTTDFTDKIGLSIKSQAHLTDECFDIHNSLIIQAIRAISGFCFPIQVVAFYTTMLSEKEKPPARENRRETWSNLIG